jgi:hypothetical protein
MVDLLHRIAKLERELDTEQCMCRSKSMTIRFAQDPVPEKPAEPCPVHGQRELVVEFVNSANGMGVIDWPLPRTALDE